MDRRAEYSLARSWSHASIRSPVPPNEMHLIRAALNSRLAANYQSFPLALSVLAVFPAVLTGDVLLLLATRVTLNLQSYMGIIM